MRGLVPGTNVAEGVPCRFYRRWQSAFYLPNEENKKYNLIVNSKKSNSRQVLNFIECLYIRMQLVIKTSPLSCILSLQHRIDCFGYVTVYLGTKLFQ